MTEQDKQIADLQRIALDSYRDEYREFSDNWRNLDTKAQGLVAIAGILIAAAFAWARELPSDFGSYERLLVGVSIVSLVAVVVAAILALQIRTVPTPPLGEETASMISDILKKGIPEELADRVSNFYNDQIKMWHGANADLKAQCENKALCITCGQLALLLAAILVGVPTFMPIFCKLWPSMGF